MFLLFHYAVAEGHWGPGDRAGGHMDSDKRLTRTKRLANSVADAGYAAATEEVSTMVDEGVRWFFQRIKQEVIKWYEKQVIDQAGGQDGLAELERQISRSNEAVEIGVRQGELSMMWAMKQLGYPAEDIEKVVEVAHKSYEESHG